MIIVKGNCVGEIYPVRDETESFSHFRYVVSRIEDERSTLLDGVANDIEAARAAVLRALDVFASDARGWREGLS
jgi:hypothetical protein